MRQIGLKGYAVPVILALVSLGSPHASAGQLEDGQACSIIQDSLQRLTCFDKAFPKSAAPPIKEPEASLASSTWEISEEKSLIDDSPKVGAVLRPKSYSSSGYGQEPLLVMRCAENVTAIVLSHGATMIDDSAQVTFRFGAAPAERGTWQSSSNYQSVGLWTGTTAIPFIRRMVDEKRLVFRVEGRARVDAEFDLGNVLDAARKVADACHWGLVGE